MVKELKLRRDYPRPLPPSLPKVAPGTPGALGESVLLADFRDSAAWFHPEDIGGHPRSSPGGLPFRRTRELILPWKSIFSCSLGFYAILWFIFFFSRSVFHAIVEYLLEWANFPGIDLFFIWQLNAAAHFTYWEGLTFFSFLAFYFLIAFMHLILFSFFFFLFFSPHPEQRATPSWKRGSRSWKVTRTPFNFRYVNMRLPFMFPSFCVASTAIHRRAK